MIPKFYFPDESSHFPVTFLALCTVTWFSPDLCWSCIEFKRISKTNPLTVIWPLYEVYGIYR